MLWELYERRSLMSNESKIEHDWLAHLQPTERVERSQFSTGCQSSTAISGHSVGPLSSSCLGCVNPGLENIIKGVVVIRISETAPTTASELFIVRRVVVAA
jgi:hypothetical protein